MAVYRYSEVRGTLLCTSTTHPSNPSPGDRIYETDTGKELQWQGPNNGWTLPWGVAWGAEGRVTLITASTGQTTMANGTAITGFNVAWSAVVNRRYKITAGCELVPSATTLTMVGISIPDTVSTQFNRDEVPNNQLLGITLVSTAVVSGLATTARTTSVNAVSGGTGTMSTANFAGTRPAYLVIEDIGPSGNPT